MNTLHKALSLILLVLILALPVYAQEATEDLPAWTAALPAVLGGLVFANFRATEAFKRLLASPRIGGVPPKDIQSILVLAFSIGFGIVSAWITPTATDWLGTPIQTYPIAAIVLTGLTVSTVGSGVYEVLNRLSAGVPVYSTTTTINTPPADIAPVVAKDTLAVAAQVVKSDKQ